MEREREREKWDGTLAEFGEKPIPPRWIDRFRVIAIEELGERGRKGQGERDAKHLLTKPPSSSSSYFLLLPFVSREVVSPEIHKLRIFRRVENFRII